MPAPATRAISARMDKDMLHDVVRAALAAGADAAEAVAAERSALSVGVRLGALEEVEREHIARVVSKVAHFETAARILGIDVTTLQRKRKRYGLA